MTLEIIIHIDYSFYLTGKATLLFKPLTRTAVKYDQ